MFPNLSQTASFMCPDGTLFYWTVPAERSTQSTAQANAVALALAQKRVAQNYICFSELTNQPCLDTEYTDLVVIDDGNFKLTHLRLWAAICLRVNDYQPWRQSAAITGIAIIAGTYLATIRAT
jgi:hypothetical protein